MINHGLLMYYDFSLLGDIERLRQQLHDSDVEKQSLKQRIEQLTKKQQDEQQNAVNLQLTVSFYS